MPQMQRNPQGIGGWLAVMNAITNIEDYRPPDNAYLVIEHKDEGQFEIGDEFELDGFTWEIFAINNNRAYARVAAVQH